MKGGTRREGGSPTLSRYVRSSATRVLRFGELLEGPLGMRSSNELNSMLVSKALQGSTTSIQPEMPSRTHGCLFGLPIAG